MIKIFILLVLLVVIHDAKSPSIRGVQEVTWTDALQEGPLTAYGLVNQHPPQPC